MVRNCFFTFISILFIGILSVSAQTKSTEIQTINSVQYYIHTVQAKETFYGLSKLYGVSIDDIQMSNDNLRSLSIGQQIKIPVVAETAAESQYKDGELIVKNGQSFVVHNVQQGETIYALARHYQTSAGQILAANPAINNGQITIGQQLFIPFSGTVVPPHNIAPQNTTTVNDNPYDTTNQQIAQNDTTTIVKKNDVYISLMLPFFLDKNTQQSDEGIINKPKEIYTHTYQFLEYYEGVLMAIDTLKSRGMNITLDVIESNNDSTSINISKIKTNTNLIIGPVFPKTFPAVAGFAKRHSIPIISPLSTEETNATNPFVVQMNTPQKFRFKAMVDYIIQHNDHTHVCIVYNNESLEKKSMNLCKAAFNERKSDLESKHISFEEIYFPSAGTAGLDRALGKKENAIVVVLSKQQAFANNIVTKLYQASKSHKIELWGLPQWETYENLELDFLYDLKFKLVTSGEVDYTSPLANQFIKRYREKYGTEPTKFSFQGYDQMLYIVNQYATTADFINDLVQDSTIDGLYNDFKFFRKDGATVNTASFIVEYDKATFNRYTTAYNPNN